jgi:pimeloyl-ACP methyl ester carboxylesterase
VTDEPAAAVDGAAAPVTVLRHGLTELALHHLRPGSGRPLLLLHGLGERSPDEVPEHLAVWPGPVAALDFTGHGNSTVPAGGGYTAEALIADADAALADLGPSTVVGRGLGAYIALLASGARADLVHGAVLMDGPGLVGGGIRPPSPHVAPIEATGHTPDPFAMAELSRDVRPPDYAVEFVRMAVQSSGLDKPIAVSAVVRPEWLAAVVGEFGVTELSVAKALALYA